MTAAGTFRRLLQRCVHTPGLLKPVPDAVQVARNAATNACARKRSLLKPHSEAVQVSSRAASNGSFRFSDLTVQLASESEKAKRPDERSLRFGDCFSDHMFEVDWGMSTGWRTPRIVPLHQLVFHPASKIFHYAQALFEGMKAFRSSDGTILLFRPELNIQRMLETAHRAALPPFDPNEFLLCLKKLVSVDRGWIPGTAGSSLYIRPTFIGTQNSLGVHASNTALLFIITGPVGPYYKAGATQPVALLADPQYVRAWPSGVGDKKMACNYAPTLFVQNIAEREGLQQVLWLYGEDEQVTEVGAMNVFFFFKKAAGQYELATPPLNGTILPGVVRRSLLELARDLNEFEVNERVITMREVIKGSEDGSLLEMFGSGTACSVCPVDRIRYKDQDVRIATVDQSDPLYLRMYKMLTDIQYGRVKSDWSVVVE